MKIAFVSYDFPEYCIRQANVMAAEHDVLLMLPENHCQEHLSLLDPGVRFEPFFRPRYRQPHRQHSQQIVSPLIFRMFWDQT